MHSRHILLGILSFQMLSSQVTARNSNALSHLFRSKPDIKMVIQHLGVPPLNRMAQKLPILGGLSWHQDFKKQLSYCRETALHERQFWPNVTGRW